MNSFFTENLTVIGMVHFSPLEGDPNFPGKLIVLDRARADLVNLIAGGVHAVMFENNFDDPKCEVLPTAQAHHFEELVAELTCDLELPWGLSLLWNDYRLGFRLCKKYGGSAVRVPVFVDSVETVYGTFLADPDQVILARDKEQASDVLILADVQVKHATMLQPRSLTDSVQDAMRHHADGIIITGTWTGDPPSVEQVTEVRNVVGNKVKLLTGSGMTPENILSFKPVLNGCIVGTAFKEKSSVVTDGPNIVSSEVRYDLEKIKNFMEESNN